jgi:ACS family glucarate transporter-like MFS transporter
MKNVDQTASRLNVSRSLIVALLCSFSMISYLDRVVISIAGPRIIGEFGISATAMGTVYSAFTLGYGLFMIPGGHFTDRFGPWRTLTVMGIGSALFTGLTALGAQAGVGAVIGIVTVLFAIRFGLGVATAPLYPACARMTANWIPGSFHGRVQGLIIAGSSFGAAIAPLLFSALGADVPWRSSFVIAALATAAVALFWFWYARDYPGSQDEAYSIRAAKRVLSWAALFRNRNLLLITYAYGTLGYFQYIFFYWIYYYFEHVLALPRIVSARYTTFVFVIEGLIMPLGGLLSDRLTKFYGAQFGRRIVPIFALSLGATFLFIGSHRAGFPAALCLALACGLAACCEGPFWATVTDLEREQVGGASGILNTGAQIGGLLAPVLTPLIAERADWRSALYAGCLFAISGVIAVYAVNLPPEVEITEGPATD